MLSKVLIANRGEIAIRIARTCRRLGVEVATVHSSADRFGRHVREIGESVELGAAPATESYLDIDKVIEAARQTGADAVHPGYGFLAENAEAAAAVEAAGLKWIGPRPSTILAFGDKSKAKTLAAEAGVPIIPGVEGASSSVDEVRAAVDTVGLPALLKAVAGGGGRGMRLVESLDDLDETIAEAMSEAERSFGSSELMVERYLANARHIEVQIAGDGAGTVLHLRERECSLQRRHQKIVEEAPAPGLSDDLRNRILDAACALGRAVSYRSIGTVELILAGEEFFFLEVNPRIQVEHPVTEEITGVDLVELQLRVASGMALGIDQSDIDVTGHAFEARIYAEDPARGFLPTVGRVESLNFPSEEPRRRVESAVDVGDDITPHYDPMIAKLITWGDDRAQALDNMRAALDGCYVDGVTTNLRFLRALVDDPAVIDGRVHTQYVEAAGISGTAAPSPELVAIGAALWLRYRRRAGADDPWSSWGDFSTWRLGTGDDASCAHPVATLTAGDDAWQVLPRPGGSDRLVRLALDEEPFEVELKPISPTADAVSVGGMSLRVDHRVNDDVIFVSAPGSDTTLTVIPSLDTDVSGAASGGRTVVAPMTGQLLRVVVEVGDRVSAGQTVAVMESMKLELPIEARTDGVVTVINAMAESIIERGSVVMEIEPDDQ